MTYIGKTIIDVLELATDEISVILMKHDPKPEVQRLITSTQELLLDLLVNLKDRNESVTAELEATSDDLKHIEESINDAHEIVKGARKQLKNNMDVSLQTIPQTYQFRL